MPGRTVHIVTPHRIICCMETKLPSLSRTRIIMFPQINLRCKVKHVASMWSCWFSRNRIILAQVLTGRLAKPTSSATVIAKVHSNSSPKLLICSQSLGIGVSSPGIFMFSIKQKMFSDDRAGAEEHTNWTQNIAVGTCDRCRPVARTIAGTIIMESEKWEAIH